MADMSRPLVPANTWTRLGALFLGGLFSAALTWLIWAAIEIQATGRIIVTEIEGLKTWQAELEADVGALRRDMEASNASMNARIDAIYRVLLEEKAHNDE